MTPAWAIRYAEAVRRATTNGRKPWRHLFTWNEVNSYAWEIACEIWPTWEEPHVRSPERWANSDLTKKVMNRLDAEARKLGWSRKRQPDGTWKWFPPPNIIAPPRLISDYAYSPGADVWIDGECVSQEELQENVRVLARNYASINVEADRLAEPQWEQFSEWNARNERMRRIRLARQTAEAALAMYAYEVLKDAA